MWKYKEMKATSQEFSFAAKIILDIVGRKSYIGYHGSGGSEPNTGGESMEEITRIGGIGEAVRIAEESAR